MTFKHENRKISEGYARIVGCDEVGRGCLAGPVVAAAVVLKKVTSDKLQVTSLRGIRDSKELAPEKREELSEIIKENFLWSIGEVSQDVIDKINIHNASLLAMRKAVEGVIRLLGDSIPEFFHTDEYYTVKKYPGSRTKHDIDAPDSGPRFGGRGGYTRSFLFVDGKFPVPNIAIGQQAVIGGDNKILSVAAASIIAKVYRDNLMRKLHIKFPIYNFAKHKGYATEYHRAMVIRYGLSPIHRLSFCSNLVS